MCMLYIQFMQAATSVFIQYSKLPYPRMQPLPRCTSPLPWRVVAYATKTSLRWPAGTLSWQLQGGTWYKHLDGRLMALYWPWMEPPTASRWSTVQKQVIVIVTDRQFLCEHWCGLQLFPGAGWHLIGWEHTAVHIIYGLVVLYNCSVYVCIYVLYKCSVLSGCLVVYVCLHIFVLGKMVAKNQFCSPCPVSLFSSFHICTHAVTPNPPVITNVTSLNSTSISLDWTHDKTCFESAPLVKWEQWLALFLAEPTLSVWWL